jgi:Tfp pilus assembly protein PilN
MDMDILKLVLGVLSILGTLFGAVKWILSAKIAPLNTKIVELEKENKRLDDENAKQTTEIENLKTSLINELQSIATANFEFRREYENGLNDIKLMIAENYLKKEDVQRELTDIHQRIDVSHDVKTIMESLKQLNS